MSRGGARKGSGRKKLPERKKFKSDVLRVPKALVKKFKSEIKEFKDNSSRKTIEGNKEND